MFDVRLTEITFKSVSEVRRGGAFIRTPTSSVGAAPECDRSKLPKMVVAGAPESRAFNKVFSELHNPFRSLQ